MDRNTVSVERVITAPSEQIFARLADAGKHTSFDGSKPVNHASLQPVPSCASGRCPSQWVRNSGWQCEGVRSPPADAGTLVRETWDVSQAKQKWMIKSGSVPQQTGDGMRATPERIAKLLEG